MRQEQARAIREYYGTILGSARDLRTSACCSLSPPAPHLRSLLARIDERILSRFYGCGSPIPPAIESCTVLDLGCGTGRDVFLCAALAGPGGRVIGLDMTDEQLEVGRRLRDEQCARLELPGRCVEFRTGLLEELDAAGIEDASVDVVISNCVINLSPDKPRVFDEVLRVLRPGGELLFSDIFADRRLPGSLRQDPVLLGECLAGAMYFEDFRRLLSRRGLFDVRVVSRRPVEIEDPALRAAIGPARFESLTVRVFRIDGLEDRCEDYGQIARYLGTVPHEPAAMRLDDHHLFEVDRPQAVCGNTAAMIERSRLAPHFLVEGDRSRHFGLFPCASDAASPAAVTGGACC